MHSFSSKPQDLPGDNQRLSLYFHAGLWLLRVLSWSLVENAYLRLMHELAYETKPRHSFMCDPGKTKARLAMCFGPLARLSGVERRIERKRDAGGGTVFPEGESTRLTLWSFDTGGRSTGPCAKPDALVAGEKVSPWEHSSDRGNGVCL